MRRGGSGTAREEVNAPPPGPRSRCFGRVASSELGPSRLGGRRKCGWDPTRVLNSGASWACTATRLRNASERRTTSSISRQGPRSVREESHPLVLPDDLVGALQALRGGQMGEHAIMVGRKPRTAAAAGIGPCEQFLAHQLAILSGRKVLEGEHPASHSLCLRRGATSIRAKGFNRLVSIGSFTTRRPDTGDAARALLSFPSHLRGLIRPRDPTG